MGISYQDINIRLQTVEAKLDLVMQVASVTKRTPSIVSPGDFVVERVSLKDLYNELQALGTSLEPIQEQEKVNGTDSD